MLYEAYELKSHAFVKQHVTTPIGAIYHFSKLHQTSLMLWLHMRGKQAAYNALELFCLAQLIDLIGYACKCARSGLWKPEHAHLTGSHTKHAKDGLHAASESFYLTSVYPSFRNFKPHDVEWCYVTGGCQVVSM